jgi:hypothetical protein
MYFEVLFSGDGIYAQNTISDSSAIRVAFHH